MENRCFYTRSLSYGSMIGNENINPHEIITINLLHLPNISIISDCIMPLFSVRLIWASFKLCGIHLRYQFNSLITKAWWSKSVLLCQLARAGGSGSGCWFSSVIQLPGRKVCGWSPRLSWVWTHLVVLQMSAYTENASSGGHEGKYIERCTSSLRQGFVGPRKWSVSARVISQGWQNV